MLSHLQNEAQLAVVLGHEIGHVAARHASRQALKAQAGQLGLIAGVIVGQEVLDDPQAAGQMLNLGGALFQLLLTKYSRDAERESDDLAVEYAAREGYDAAEGAEFFRSLQRISEQQGAILPSWQSTHPDPGEREQAIIRLARELNPEEAYLPEFQQTAEAFQTVTNPQVLQVAPSRLAIVTAQKNSPFRSFLPSQMPPGLTPLDLAILNQVELDEPIPRGKPLKMPR